MNHTPKKRPAEPPAGQMTIEEPKPTLGLGKRQAGESGILKVIGHVQHVKLADDQELILFPMQGRKTFRADQKAEAREFFQMLARTEKGYPSGWNPLHPDNGLELVSQGQGEAFNARAVRKLCKDDVPLGDFLDCCVIEMSKLLAFVDQADGSQAERARVKQQLLRFQAQQRLKG
jgi:hypothetical protein